MQGAITDHRALTSGLVQSQRLTQHRTGPRSVLQEERHAVKAADRVFGWNVTLAPPRLIRGIRHANEREAHAIRIGEGQHAFAEPSLQGLMRHPLLDEAVGPIAQRLRRNTEGSLLRLTHSAATLSSLLPQEERKDRARPAGLVAVIEVIRRRVVEID